ncbi:MAG: exosortase/archaeosortase family protein [Candidatus Diapherotrites archaeon]|nr:exosortase/archaeosortase family protein [Candidatus Diapherotrites archaeon]
MAKKSASKKKSPNTFIGHSWQRFSKQSLKKELLASAKFLIFFLISFSIIFIIFSFLPIEIFEFFTAKISAAILEAVGYSTKIITDEPVKIIVNSKHTIEISYLCTGIIETIVVVSAVAASLGISLKKRLIGALAGAIFVNVLNILRIIVTIVAISNLKDIGFVDFIHNVLFRATLFVGIAVYYAVWFFASTRSFNPIARFKLWLFPKINCRRNKKQ